MENLGWKMLSRISNLGGGKFGVEFGVKLKAPLKCLPFKILDLFGMFSSWGISNLGG